MPYRVTASSPSRPVMDLHWRRRAGLFALGYLLLAPIIILALAQRLLIRRRRLVHWATKCSGRIKRVPPGAVVVHGVSMGEVMLMRALVPALEDAGLGPCLLTTTTETGDEALARQFPVHHRAPWPFDLPWATARFLQRSRPRAVILLELELWPLLLCACFQRQIPVLIVNARISARSFRGYHRARAVLRPLLRRLAGACCQNRLWAARLQALGLRHCPVTGSLKADMVSPADDQARDAEARRIGLEPGPAQAKQVFLIASTSHGEEDALYASWTRWGAEPGWRLVICPRHPERGPALERMVANDGRPVWRSSGGGPPPGDPATVVIVDEIGRLGALYANASLCVVGGGLGSGRGGQNMLEAAAAGCATVVGPDYRNQPDAMAVLRAAQAVAVLDPASPDATLAPLATDPARRQAMGIAGRAAWDQARGAAPRTVAAIASLLASAPRPTIVGPATTDHRSPS